MSAFDAWWAEYAGSGGEMADTAKGDARTAFEAGARSISHSVDRETYDKQRLRADNLERDNTRLYEAEARRTVSDGHQQEELRRSREYARALKEALDEAINWIESERAPLGLIEFCRAALAKNPNGAKTVTPSCAEGQGASEASTGSSPTYCASCGGLMAESGCCNACGRAALAVGRRLPDEPGWKCACGQMNCSWASSCGRCSGAALVTFPRSEEPT